MSAKLIIWCPGRPALNGHKRRLFLWSPIHSCYVYQNKELDEQQFNDVAPLVFKKNYDLHPCVKVVAYSGGAVPFTPAPPPDPEITVAQAEEVMTRLAPHRLKGKTGPKAAVPKLQEVG